MQLATQSLERSKSVMAACETAAAINCVLALRTLTEAEKALREHKSGFAERKRLESIWAAAKVNAHNALQGVGVESDLLWKGLI